ncbi:unnamed protein product [Prorocentrum cordatum]|uniref:Uncharacterized protein n=1 Tax=Prorocentrum cordatum TaxID=2364126 RepID=A0ABN9Q1I7_9DINO|nr:unnamed protein product [Polarella glacialis]
MPQAGLISELTRNPSSYWETLRVAGALQVCRFRDRPPADLDEDAAPSLMALARPLLMPMQVAALAACGATQHHEADRALAPHHQQPQHGCLPPPHSRECPPQTPAALQEARPPPSCTSQPGVPPSSGSESAYPAVPSAFTRFDCRQPAVQGPGPAREAARATWGQPAVLAHGWHGAVSPPRPPPPPVGPQRADVQGEPPRGKPPPHGMPPWSRPPATGARSEWFERIPRHPKSSA